MGGYRHLVAFLVGAAALLGAEDSLAEGRDPLTRWTELAAGGDVDGAAEGLRREAAAATTPAGRLRALEALGRVYYDAGRQGDARRAFRSLLEVDPGHRLGGDASRRLRRFYGRLQRRFEPTAHTDIEARAPPVLPRTGQVRIHARVSGMTDGVDRAAVRVRPSGARRFERVPMDREGLVFTCHVPVPTAGRALEYFVEVLAPSGAVLVSTGTPRDPQVIAVAQDGEAPEPEPPEVLEPATPPVVEAHPAAPEDDATRAPDPAPSRDETADTAAVGEPTPRRGAWYSSWWFWTIVGVLVAGGTATALALTLPPTYEGGSLGLMYLP